MSDSSPGNPVSNRQVTVKTLGEVIAEEHAQLLVRRKNAEVVLQPESEISGKGSPQDNDADIDWMKDTLTGVALSGGGVRSGAISLGFLMGLAKCNALRLVDYLSTVSGGGYAGAVLSAEAERLNRLKSDTQQKDSFAPLFEDSQCPSDSASTHAGCPRRLQRLVSQSNYLIKNKGWASRAAFGVVALGTLLVSALICVAALMAYLFRDLHTPEIYDYLHCLGLRGDLWVAMLPACLVFVVWITFWALSFVLHRRQAEGVRAKYVFFALIATTLAGVTLVATTGDVDFGDFLVTLGFTDAKWNALGEFGNWFKAAVLTAICASLLPYFKPSALLQSGREKREGGKRMLFRIARNGLLFGVPLLFFSFFARENISGWHKLRDSRLDMRDLLSPPNGMRGDRTQLRSHVLYAPEPPPRDAKLGRFWPAVAMWLPLPSGLNTQPDDSVMAAPALREIRGALAKSVTALSRDRRTNSSERLDPGLRQFLANADLSQKGNWDELSFGNENQQKKRSVRLAAFGEYLIAKLVPQSRETVFGDMLSSQRDQRRLTRQTMFLINRSLLNPEMIDAVDELIESVESRKIDGDEGSRDSLAAFAESYHQAKRSLAGLDSEAKEYLKGLAKSVQEHELDAAANTPVTEQTLLAAAPRDDKLTPAENLRVQVIRQQTARAVLEANRSLLELAFPQSIRSRRPDGPIFSTVVLNKDQQIRWRVFITALLVALVASLVIDLNATSWHGFYAKQLSSFWVNAGADSKKTISLESLNTVQSGRPYHLINAAVWLLGQPELGDDPIRDENPDEFLLSRLYCGSDHTNIGFVASSASGYGHLTLGDAIALSGAAVSPWSTRNNLVRALMLVLNFRTGLWLPHPLKHAHPKSKSLLDRIDEHIFAPLRWLCLRFIPQLKNGRLQWRRAEDWSHLLVTDGGHYENLGVDALLRRRCRLVIAVDSTEDAEYCFSSLASAMRRMRVAHGVEFFAPGTNRPFTLHTGEGEDRQLRQPRFHAIEIRYPEVRDDSGTILEAAATGLMVVIKSTVLPDDAFELTRFRKEYPSFPNDPTSDQFFDAERFEAYRYLGLIAAEDFLRKVTGASPHDADITAPVTPEKLRDSAFAAFGIVDEQTAGPHPNLRISQIMNEVDAFIQEAKSNFYEVSGEQRMRQLKKLTADLQVINRFAQAGDEESKGLRTSRWSLTADLPDLLLEFTIHSHGKGEMGTTAAGLQALLETLQLDPKIASRAFVDQLENFAETVESPESIRDLLSRVLVQCELVSPSDTEASNSAN